MARSSWSRNNLFSRAGKKIRVGLAALLLALALIGVGMTQIARSTDPLESPGVRLLGVGPAGLELAWSAPPLRTRLLTDGTAAVVADGYAQDQRPGAPRLPFTATLVALPPGAVPELEILPTQEAWRPLPAPLALAPRPGGVLRDGRSYPIGGAYVPAAGPGPARPTTPVTLEEIGVLRGVRLARLTFYPAILQGEGLRVVRRVHLRIKWSTDAQALAVVPDPLLDEVRRSVLNPWPWAYSPAREGGERQETGFLPLESSGGGVLTAFVEVATPGLYRVGYQDLAYLGFAAADPQYLRLFRGADEVAYEWQGDADDLFETDEALLFYAEPRSSRWTDVDVYRLIVGDTPGVRMMARSADPSGLAGGATWVTRRVEENHIYTPDCFCGSLPPGRDGDRWVWARLRQPDEIQVSLPFQTPALDAGRPASATLWFIGYTGVATQPDHRVEVAFNGVRAGLVTWDGKAAVTATLPITPGVLHSGPNTLTLTLTGLPDVFVEGMWLDGFALRYARSLTATGAALRFEGRGGQHAYTVALTDTAGLRAYDVTEPLRPQKLSGFQLDGHAVTLGDPPGTVGERHRYSVAGEKGILQPVRIRARREPRGFAALGEFTGAEWLVITHPDFVDALGPLIDLRDSQELGVAVVNVMGIYDVWGDGRPDPEAIRAFIAAAYATWDPRPVYVLLVGDGSFDPRGYRPTSIPNFIPPYLADVDPWAGETAADNRYVCVDGDDALPDLLLGRLPVETLKEARVAVSKTLDYETAPLPGGWNRDVLLVADDADLAGDFAASSEAYAAASVTPPFTATRRYCSGLLPDASDCSSQEVQALHAALLSDWNRGALLAQFTGHASWHQWAAERFFHLDDLVDLYNDRRFPVVLEMTCFTGAFQRPEATLDEGLLTLPGGGAAAVWGATGLGVGTGHDRLSQGFFGAVFQDGADRVGQATLAGKLNLAASGQNLDLLDTYLLLGDPALKLNRTLLPWASQVFMPFVR